MARLLVDGDDVVLHLSRLEKLGALHGDVRVPLAAVRNISVTGDPWKWRRGVRVLGTGVPGRVSLGRRRGARGVKDFAAVYQREEGILIDLKGVSFHRLVVSARNASATVELIADAQARARR